MTDEEKIAQYMATRRPIRVAEGVGGLAQPKRTEDDLIRERRCVVDHAGREHWMNGLGEPL